MNTRLATFFVPVCLGSMGVIMSAHAQNTLTIPMEVARIGNPNMVPERQEGSEAVEARRGDVTVFRLHPQYTLQMTDGASRTQLSLGGLIERSGDTALSADRNLPSVSVLWERGSPTGVFGLRASLAEEATREAEFAEFGRVSLDGTQRTGTIGATWNMDLTSSTDLELAASHARVKYDTPRLRDYDETGLSARYRWQHSAENRFSLSTTMMRQRRSGEMGMTEDRDRISRHGVALGYESDLSESLNLTTHVGVVRTGSPDSRTHSVGGLRLAHEGERLTYALEWARDVSADGSVRGYTRADTLGASLSYPVSADTTLIMGISRARSLEAERDEGSSAYARLLSELTPFWAVTAGVEHRRARSSSMPSAKGHAVTLGLVYTHPDF